MSTATQVCGAEPTLDYEATLQVIADLATAVLDLSHTPEEAIDRVAKSMIWVAQRGQVSAGRRSQPLPWTTRGERALALFRAEVAADVLSGRVRYAPLGNVREYVRDQMAQAVQAARVPRALTEPARPAVAVGGPDIGGARNVETIALVPTRPAKTNRANKTTRAKTETTSRAGVAVAEVKTKWNSAA